MRPNFSMRLCLRTRGEFTIANFGLKIDPFWDHENCSPFSLESKRIFGEANCITFLTYLKAIHEQKKKKNERNCFFNFCRSKVGFSWKSLLIITFNHIFYHILICCTAVSCAIAKEQTESGETIELTTDNWADCCVTVLKPQTHRRAGTENV